MILDIILTGPRKPRLYYVKNGRLEYIEPQHSLVPHYPYFFVKYTPENERKAEELLKKGRIVNYSVVEKYHYVYQEKRKYLMIEVERPAQVRYLRTEFTDADVYEADIQYVVRWAVDLDIYPGLPIGYADGMDFQKSLLEPVEYPREDIVAFDIEVLNESPIEFPTAYEDLRVLAEHITDLEKAKKYIDSNGHIAKDRVLSVSLAYYKEGRVQVELHVLQKYTPTPDLKEYVKLVAKKGAQITKKEVVCRSGEHEIDIGTEKVEVKVVCHRTEEDLLRTVWDVLEKYRVWITYNGNAFDIPYLFYRSLRLGVVPPRLKVVGKANIQTSGKEVLMIYPEEGIHADLYLWFSKPVTRSYVHGNAYNEYTLDAVATAVLGVRKYQIDMTKLPSSLDFDELVKYSGTDAYLALKLFEADYDIIVRLMRATGVPLSILFGHQISRWIYYLLVRYHSKQGAIFPNRYDIQYCKIHTRDLSETGKGYIGAYVHEPPIGAFFGVTTLDVASLYPTMFIVHNISYETVDNPHILKNCRNVEEIRHPKTGQVIHRICKDRHGVVSRLIQNLRDIRLYFKHKGYKEASNALKVLINAMYGVFGTQSFPLYSGLAEVITLLGRKTILSIIDYAQRQVHIPVLYSDTDSVFLWTDRNELAEKVVEHARKLGVELELDKKYRFVVFSGRKKNYLGVLEDGTVVIKGMMAIKSNTPEYFKELFDQVVQRLAECTEPKCVVNVIEEAKKLVNTFSPSKVNPEKLTITVTLNKNLYEYKGNLVQVRVAKRLMKYGYPVEKGSKIHYILTANGEMPLLEYYLFGRASVNERKYREMLKSVFTQLLDAFGGITSASSLTVFLKKREGKKEKINKEFEPDTNNNNYSSEVSGLQDMILAVGNRAYIASNKYLIVHNMYAREVYVLRLEGDIRKKPVLNVLEEVEYVNPTNAGILAVKKYEDFVYALVDPITSQADFEFGMPLGKPVYVVPSKLALFVNPTVGKLLALKFDPSAYSGFAVGEVKLKEQIVDGYGLDSGYAFLKTTESTLAIKILDSRRVKFKKFSKGTLAGTSFILEPAENEVNVYSTEDFTRVGAIRGELIGASYTGRTVLTTEGVYKYLDGEFKKVSDYSVKAEAVVGIRSLYVIIKEGSRLLVETIVGKKGRQVYEGAELVWVSPDRKVALIKTKGGGNVVIY